MPRRRTGPTRLCIVEDHPVLREGLALVLGQSGFDVICAAADAETGAPLIRAHQPDVAIVDLLLPDEHGSALTRRLLGEQPVLRVLIYTGAEAPADLEPALTCGAHGIISKSSPPEEFRQAIRTVADGGTYIDERIRRRLAGADPAVERVLSKREREVLALLASGLTLEQAANRLVLSPETIRTHARNAGRRLGGRTRVHTISLALMRGEVQL